MIVPSPWTQGKVPTKHVTFSPHPPDTACEYCINDNTVFTDPSFVQILEKKVLMSPVMARWWMV